MRQSRPKVETRLDWYHCQKYMCLDESNAWLWDTTMGYHAGPTMVSRSNLSHLLGNVEVSWWPSASSRCFTFVLAALWWMDGCGGWRRERQYIEEHIGHRASRTTTKRAWADRPGPTDMGPFWPRFTPWHFWVNYWVAPLCMWALDVVFSMV
jgi:hypothetical protein